MSENISDLSRLKPAPGSIKKRKRIGRGRSSGYGDTATKGHKGAKSRSGYKDRPNFEGGQMPIQRRIPKRGFKTRGRTNYLELNISDLARLDTDTVNPESLKEARIINGRGPVVLLGNGDTDKAYNVSVHRITKSAADKIEKAGGKVEILSLDPVDRRVKIGPKKRTTKKETSEKK